MKRLFWIGVGVAVTVVALREFAKVTSKVDQVAGAVTPAGIAASINNLARNVGTMGSQLKQALAQHEDALREALLPSEETLAKARQTRAHRGPYRYSDEDLLPDDGTEYF